MIILGVDTSTINWYLVLYVISSIAFLGFGTNYVYPTGQIRGVIFGIGAALVLFYFGLRWFANPVNNSTEWPPVINMCPDYLTYIPNININSAGSSSTPPAAGTVAVPTTRGGCVDMLGVSSNRYLKKTTATALPSLSTSADGTPGGNTYKIFGYTYENIKAAIAKGNNEGTATETKGSADITAICNACKTAGITWEGVFDGDTCIALNSFNLIAKKVAQCITPS